MTFKIERLWNRYSGFFVLAILIPFFVIPVQAESTVDLDLAINLLKEKKYEGLVYYVDKILKNSPNDTIALSYKAQALWEMDRYYEAHIFANRVLEINPQEEQSLYIKAKALYKNEKYQEALEVIDQAILVNPYNDKTQNRKGLILYRLGNYDEAIKQYDKAIELNPLSFSAMERKGELLFELGKYDEAVSYFERASERNPQDQEILDKLNHSRNLVLFQEYGDLLFFLVLCLVGYGVSNFRKKNSIGRIIGKLKRQEIQ